MRNLITTNETLSLEKIERCNNSINYCKEALSQPDIKKWETREFTEVLEDIIEKLKNETENHNFCVNRGLFQIAV